MNHAIEFIETPLFTRQIKTIATDDELKELQMSLSSIRLKATSFRKRADCAKSEWRAGHKGKAVASG